MSFSIDALLAKDPPRRDHPSTGHHPSSLSPRGADVGRPHPPGTPDSHRSTPSTCPSPESGTSSPLDHHMHGGSPGGSPGHGISSIVPRPGLLNMHHPALGGQGMSLPGMMPGHPFLPFHHGQGGGGGAHPPHPGMVPGGSAFHSPAEQAVRMAQAQMHSMQLQDWLAMARGGIYVPRVMDYNSEYQLL